MSSIPQPTASPQEIHRDSHGWPINPTTNQPYTADDIRANQSLLALFPPGHIAAKTLRTLSPEEIIARQANIQRKRKARRRRSTSGRPSKRVNYAALALSSPFDAGMRAAARRMDELEAEAEAEVRQTPYFRNGQFVKMLEVV